MLYHKSRCLYSYFCDRTLAGEYPEVFYQRLVQDAHYVTCGGLVTILVNGILADETLLQPYWELEILLTVGYWLIWNAGG